VGAHDTTVIQLNRQAMRQMRPECVSLEIIAGASHLFEEPGTLEQVAARTARWFVDHFRPDAPTHDDV
jgi:putative phosphoribosyl transferase